MKTVKPGRGTRQGPVRSLSVIIAILMVSVCFSVPFSENAQALDFVETLPVPWSSSFTPLDSAWDANGTQCVVVGNETNGHSPSAWLYNDPSSSWFPILEGTDPAAKVTKRVENDNTGMVYPTIQLAINNASAGDTIRLWSGTYNEKITINKPLNIVGNGSANTMINGNNTGTVIRVESNWVNISHIKVTGGPAYTGILLYKASNCRVHNCTVENNLDGICLEGSSDNVIKDNDIQNNAGVGLRTEDGEETKTVVGLTDNGGTTGYGVMFGMDTSDPQYEVMHNFEPNCQDGRMPLYCSKLIQDQVNPNYFFGTAPSGGQYNRGIIFRIDSTGTDYSILYEFRGYPTDGSGPTGELFQMGDVLYGTTTNGGPIDYGTMFRINRDGTGYAMLHAFTGGTNGYRPSYGGLAWDGSYFYGTTMYGGSSGYGCIYRINMDGTGYTHLYSLTSANGYYPYGTLAFDATYLYGVARNGGTNYGTVFRIMKTGTGFQVLHTFASTADGRNPCAGLLLQGSVLYGTTYSGATGMTGGTAFRINTDGTLYSIIHSFTSAPGASVIYGGLCMVGGMLFGMSYQGGMNSRGTIFTLNTGGTLYNVIYNFTAIPGANFPYGSLTYDGMMLYAMTYYGGAFDDGTVFRIMPDGSGFQQLHDFDGTFYNGIYPAGQVIQVGNYLYGIASEGGLYGGGAVFRTGLDGTGYTTLHNLQYSVEGGSFYYTDGLTNVGTRLYGVSYEGGAYDYGAIFSMEIDGTNPSVITSFPDSPGGAYGIGNLTWDGGSYLYGMTEGGGASSMGTIFRVEIATNNVDYLYSFPGTPEPRYPRGSLLDDGEFLYGASNGGGTSDRGTVFKMEKSTSIVTVIHNFSAAPDLQYPRGTLVQDGTYLYGLTGSGGADGNGGIFRLRKDGSDYYNMHSFIYSESGYGSGHLAIDGSMLYGMASEGALYGYGTVFRMNKDTFAFSTLHDFQNEEHYYTNLAIVRNFATSSIDNFICHNNFINNVMQADDSSSGPGNFWCDVYPIGGNYWSDYTGVDNIPPGGGDGIGDSVYTVPGTAGAMDSYPFMIRDGWAMPYTTFLSVAWDNVNQRFWISGEYSAGTLTSLYYILASTPTVMVPIIGPEDTFSAVAADSLGNILLGGNNMEYLIYYRPMYMDGSLIVENGTDAMYGWNITGITFNSVDQRFYIVGNVNNMDVGVAFFTDPLPFNQSSPKCYIDTSDFMNAPGIGGLKSISWNPVRNYSIAVGDGVYRLNPYNGNPSHQLAWSTVKAPEAGRSYFDISWDRNGWNEAGIVGQNGTYGTYWRYYHTNQRLIDGNTSAVSGTKYKTCAMKPPSSPKWLIIPHSGGALRINIQEKDESGVIVFSANKPQIFSVKVWKQSDLLRPNLLNTQVEADSTYTFFIEGNYTVGGVDMWSALTIDIAAWFDNGFMGASSQPLDPTWSNSNFRTRQFNITYNVALGFATIVYPTPPPPIPPVREFYISSYWSDPLPHGSDGYTHRVLINVTFNKQTYAADGTGFLNGPAAGGAIWDKALALNDPGSWDMQVHIFDTSMPSMYNITWEEFGIKQFASISSMGSPTGSAPPGETGYYLGSCELHYSSNVAYFVTVSIPDLHMNGDPLNPKYIPVNSLYIQNFHSLAPGYSDIESMTYFSLPNSPMNIWGIGNPIPTPITVPIHGTESSGPLYSDYTAAAMGAAFETTEFGWWIDVPVSVSAGVYRAIITVTITD